MLSFPIFVCANGTVLIKILSIAAEYLTITEVETPVPPEILEFNVSSTLSLLARL